MINGKTVLAIIPARGGSKGVPRKNIRPLLNKPLIAWTIEEGRKSKYIDRLILSSEDEEIIEVAKAWDCEVPFVRPVELSLDATPGMDPVMHAVRMVPDYDYIVLLQPTSPLRLAEDIDGCLEQCVDRQASVCVSVTEPDKSPYWMYKMDAFNRIAPLIDTREYATRQELPKVFTCNGAVYAADREWLLRNGSFFTEETTAYLMPKERSIDIDTELDFLIAETILAKNGS